jgi:hypothetical protein
MLCPLLRTVQTRWRIVPGTRSASIFLRRIVGIMFMRVNAKLTRRGSARS